MNSNPSVGQSKTLRGQWTIREWWWLAKEEKGSMMFVFFYVYYCYYFNFYEFLNVILIVFIYRFGHVFMSETGTSVGEISGQSKPINSCDFRPARPFRIITGSEDNTIGVFEGPPFKFKMTKQVCNVLVLLLCY